MPVLGIKTQTEIDQQREIARLQAALIAAEAKISELEATVASGQTEIKRLHQAASEQSGEFSALKRENGSLQSEIRKLREAHDELRDTNWKNERLLKKQAQKRATEETEAQLRAQLAKERYRSSHQSRPLMPPEMTPKEARRLLDAVDYAGSQKIYPADVFDRLVKTAGGLPYPGFRVYTVCELVAAGRLPMDEAKKILNIIVSEINRDKLEETLVGTFCYEYDQISQENPKHSLEIAALWDYALSRVPPGRVNLMDELMTGKSINPIQFYHRPICQGSTPYYAAMDCLFALLEKHHMLEGDPRYAELKEDLDKFSPSKAVGTSIGRFSLPTSKDCRDKGAFNPETTVQILRRMVDDRHARTDALAKRFNQGRWAVQFAADKGENFDRVVANHGEEFVRSCEEYSILTGQKPIYPVYGKVKKAVEARKRAEEEEKAKAPKPNKMERRHLEAKAEKILKERAAKMVARGEVDIPLR